MKGSKWMKFTVLYIGAIVLSISQMKISPTAIREAFISTLGLTPLEVSIYVSVFAFAPVFLALPGGSLVKRFGAKKVSILVMIALFIGNLLGYYSHSFPLMLIARIIEGMSFSFIMVSSMMLLTHWFKEKGHGLAVGIFVTFSALGYAIVIYVLPVLYERYGLSNIYLYLAIVSAVIAVFYALLFDDASESETITASQPSLLATLKNGTVLKLALAMAILSFILFTFLDSYPTLFKEVNKLSLEESSLNAILFGLAGIPAGILIGFLIEKTKRPILIGIYSFLFMALACFMADRLLGSAVVIQVILLTTCISFASTCIVSAVPKVIKEKNQLEDSFAVIYLFYYIGALIGIPIVSSIVSFGSWGVALLFLTALALVAALLLTPFTRIEKQDI